MRGLKITVNGRLVCRAALSDEGQLQSTVVLGGSFREPELSVNGHIDRKSHVSEYLKWGKQQLKVGDAVSIELLETDNADEPLERHVTDSSESIAEMNKRIEEHMARLKLEIELRGKEAVVPSPKGTFCSFCGREKLEVNRLIAGPSVFICDKCIATCNDLMSGKVKSPEEGQWPERDA
jgi:hypothetical protein